MPIQLGDTHPHFDTEDTRDNNLPDDLDDAPCNAIIETVSRALNYPVRHIPIINYIIVCILTFFLIKLSIKYTRLYTKNSLLATIATNLVLYGIADTLAQSISAYMKAARQSRMESALGLTDYRTRAHSDSSVNLYSNNSGYYTDDEDDLENFMSYLDTNDGVTLPSIPLAVTYRGVSTRFQFHRLAGFMCWGFMLAFIQVWWYSFLQIYSSDPTIIAIIRKVLTDQLCFSPVSLFCFFNYTTRVLEGGTWEDAKAKLEKIYLPTLVASWSLWIPVQFVNFLLVPRSMQVPFSSTIGVFWNCYLSLRNSASAETEREGV
ncbi:hypothetical protein BABINDRAFT_9536 [Babjeviella inositovora NRRL Y-12698]|uniref:Vacuolar membrane protein n=1 Tax=Babjeviella inositovora NRRL Y-12698 TaxID=984486 RepID=A0A1E3QML6_9ASCO|nr:uncharacterized protein BABINDRAFT_9536 [Babjeviella inositovora NRRL Y-12698]ODQ78332.1 hypothetical protein BABINDRAFT_9536 [Babjeviella inositovora NRRL Y-12698]